ncbi:hypothetical protein HNQ94_002186 [Salirhabdus euzebyi]|uniref:Uncharacterized protein n=1 Tax=Salirhabdus euzebyi TaxID=394506 RepID=A0A841Q5V5_9BACI|nr:hypothetical protein [Salirhabdus euzebyi]MBB6453737.1 hypothetical protein [Salirhabdus euzebyi]
MGFMTKLFGIPNKKTVYTKNEVIEAARMIIPNHKLEIHERILMNYYHKERIAEALCNSLPEGLVAHANLSKVELDAIMWSTFIERFAVYYALNAYVIGFITGYSEKIGKLHVCEPNLARAYDSLMLELQNETSGMNYSRKSTEVFQGVFNSAFKIGEELSQVID